MPRESRPSAELRPLRRPIRRHRADRGQRRHGQDAHAGRPLSPPCGGGRPVRGPDPGRDVHRGGHGELRERIRRRLAEARAHFDGQPDRRYSAAPPPRTGGRSGGRPARRLAEAVRSFDEAAVFTIHGFCQRVLTDCAFESGQPFASELLPDEHDLLQEVVDDFWRRTVPGSRPSAIEYLVDQRVTPDTLLTAVRPHLGKPYLVVAPPEEPTDGRASRGRLRGGLPNAPDRWAADRRAVGSPALATTRPQGRSYPRPRSRAGGWPRWTPSWRRPSRTSSRSSPSSGSHAHAGAGHQEGPAAPRPSYLRCLPGLADARRSSGGESRDPPPAPCGGLPRLRRRGAVLAKAAAPAPRLRGPAHRAAAGAGWAERGDARRPHPAAVSRSPDRRVPGHRSRPVRRSSDGCTAGARLPLFLVGDPKQAIYGFRGADIFTYLEARRTGARDTLEQKLAVGSSAGPGDQHPLVRRAATVPVPRDQYQEVDPGRHDARAPRHRRGRRPPASVLGAPRLARTGRSLARERPRTSPSGRRWARSCGCSPWAPKAARGSGRGRSRAGTWPSSCAPTARGDGSATRCSRCGCPACSRSRTASSPRPRPRTSRGCSWPWPSRAGRGWSGRPW